MADPQAPGAPVPGSEAEADRQVGGSESDRQVGASESDRQVGAPGSDRQVGAPGSDRQVGPSESEPRVAEVLQRLRSGVRQRSAELAVLGGGAAGDGQAVHQGLAAVRAREYVQEPVALSHRRRLGRLVVLSRKAFFKLFLKWFLRPVVEQQNAFNQAAGRLLQELVEAQDRTARELRLLAARVERIESERAGSGPARAPAAVSGPAEAQGAVSEPAEAQVAVSKPAGAQPADPGPAAGRPSRARDGGPE
jgi:hypothetical protein